MKRKMIRTIAILIGSVCLFNMSPLVPNVNAETMTRQECNEKYTFDFASIYKDISQWEADYNKCYNELLPKLETYRGKLNNADDIFNYIQDSALFTSVESKLYAFAYEKCDVNQSDNEAAKLLAKLTNLDSESQVRLSFVDEELHKNSSEFFDSLMNNPKFNDYKYYIETIKKGKDKSLSEDESKIASKLQNLLTDPETSYTKLTTVDIEFPKVTDSKKNTYDANENNYGLFLSSNDRKLRRDGSEAVINSYAKYKNTFASLLTSHIKSENNYAQALGYKDAFEFSLDKEDVSDCVYNNLIDIVTKNANQYSRFYDSKRKLLDLKTINRYDLYAETSKNNSDIPFEDGKNLVLDALSIYGKDYTDKINNMINERRIDVYPDSNKVTGAYSQSMYGVKPMILMNYDNTYNSVSTLAHELGHSMYSAYSEETQPCVNAEATIFTQEIASLTNEFILINHMLKNAKTDDEKLYYLDQKINLYNSTLFTQTQFAQFEKSAYDTVEKNGVLTAEDADNIWKNILHTYDGDVINTPDYYNSGWSRIPHFYYTFYVYKYATCLMCADIISDKLINNDETALKNYMKFLKSGSSDDPIDLIKLIGIDLTNPDTMQISMNHYKSLVDEYEQIVNSK